MGYIADKIIPAIIIYPFNKVRVSIQINTSATRSVSIAMTAVAISLENGKDVNTIFAVGGITYGSAGATGEVLDIFFGTGDGQKENKSRGEANPYKPVFHF
jgi:hypothetical protein